MEAKDWSFSSTWNDGLIPVERKPEPRDYIWASELGGAMIDRYLKMKGVPYSTPPNIRSLRKFQAGNLWEWIVSLVLKRSGLIISQQNRIKYGYDGLLEVSGKIDFLGGGKPDWAKVKADLNVYDLPETILNVANKIIERFESREECEYRKLVLEIKSVSSFVYRAIEATERPMPNHILQCFHYVKGLELPQGNIVYICKDDCMIAEFPVYNNEAVEAIYKKDIETITGYYKANERPPLEKLIKFENGKFAVNKAIEYSNYLELLYGFQTPEQYRASVDKVVSGTNRVVKRIINGDKLTKNNEEKIAEMKKFFPNFDELMDEAKLMAQLGVSVGEEETED